MIRGITHRRGQLGFLAAAALITLGLAIAALHGRIQHHLSQTRHPVLSGLDNNLAKVTGIHIRSRNNSDIDIAFLPNHGWVVRNRGNYPASYNMVSKTLHAMVTLTAIEPKTAQAEWYDFIGVDSPPKGNGTLIFLTDAKGKAVASLIVGKADKADPLMTSQNNGFNFFVRRPDDPQSWLAYSPTDLHSKLTDWLDRTLIDIPSGHISEIDFRPENGPAFAIRRQETGQFHLVLMPQNKPRSTEQDKLVQIANQLAALAIADVAPQSGFDFTGKATHVLIRSADGLIVDIDIITNGTNAAEYWARISAAALPGYPGATAEARRINAKTFDWAFRLPPDDAHALNVTAQNLR